VVRIWCEPIPANANLRYISSFALIALVVAISYPSGRLAPNQELGQAFYYAIISAGLYFIVASLLVVTFFGAHKQHYDRGFNLTMSQRTMMLQTTVFLAYLLVGAAVFAHIERWKYLDAIYWGNCTLLTIGLGDLSPATALGRALLFPFAIGGIVILGLLVNSIRSQVLDRTNVKMRARMTEKERERMLEKIQKTNNTLLEPVSELMSMLAPGLANMRDSSGSLTEIERRRLEFELMRKVQKHVASKRKWLALLMSACAFLGLWFGGAAIFQVRLNSTTNVNVPRHQRQTKT
jgi:potassium channel subfamily K